jgi:hypothetical protein
MKKLYFFFGFLSLPAHAFNAIVPYYSIRSQATDSARQLVGWVQMIHLFDMDKVYGTLGITPEVTVSYNPFEIARCLFPIAKPHCPLITISGSQVPNRSQIDWLADYFLLPPDYVSTISFDPVIKNILIDLQLYLGLDEWVDGLYIQLNGPLVRTSWNLNVCEYITNKGSQPFDAGYFSLFTVDRSSLFCSFSDYITGKQLTSAFNEQEHYISLCHARWSSEKLTKKGFAAINIILGKDTWLEEKYHLGWKVRVGIPTGNTPEGLFLFEPIIGNGNHWELGVGLTGHYTFWHSDDYEKDFSFYFDANLTHLCRRTQCRTFDLCNSPASRYILIQKMGTSVDDLRAQLPNGTSQVPIAQFNTLYIPAANFTTFPVQVSIPVQLDITALFDLTIDSFTFDIGYNYWYQSCETIRLRKNRFVPLQDNTIWALKGDSRVYGYAQDSAIVPLSSTQNMATLFTGMNAQTTNPILNEGVDNPHPALTFNLEPLCPEPCQLGSAPINTSLQPIFLDTCDINLDGARTKGASHSLFFHVSYTKRYRDDWLPYIGVGSKIEFGQNRLHTHQVCNHCNECSLSQWALWIKAGLGFR